MYFQHNKEQSGEASIRHTLVVRPSDETIDTWINRPYVSNELRGQLSAANVLLVPTEDEQASRVYFPAGTERFFRFLQTSEQQSLSVDICIGDKDYQELALYADWLIIADLVVKVVVAPVVVYLICDYLEQRLGRRAQTQVKSRLTIQETGSERSTIQIDYEGPASEYRDVATEALTRDPEDSQKLNSGETNLQNTNELQEGRDAASKG